jgi:sugar lactone lactonase YvrE
MLELTATPLPHLRLQAGESPRWDQRHDLLLAVDLDAHQAVFCKAGTVETVDLPGRTGLIAPSASGGWLVSVEDRLHLLDEHHRLSPACCTVAAPGLRLNDGRCDAAGRLWAGTYGDRWDIGACAFYRVETNGVVSQIFSDITCSNGLGWSPDGQTLYYIDSGAGRIDACAFDLTAGTVGERRPVITIPRTQGVPDGLAMDVEGMIWVAIMNGKASDGLVLRCDPRNGALLAQVSVPGAGAVSACAFGGHDLRDLYITTFARQGPPSGHVFHVRVPVAGQPEHAWKGICLR